MHVSMPSCINVKKDMFPRFRGFLLRAVLACLIVTAVSAPARALHSFREPLQFNGEVDLGLHADFGLSILNGMLGEYVYSNNFKLSQIDWDLRPAVCLGFNVNMLLSGLVHVNVGFMGAVNERAGSVEDSDWLDYDSTKTHYSWHYSHIDYAYFFDVNAGLSHVFSDRFSLGVYLGYSSFKISVFTMDGYTEYPPGPENRVYINGEGIDYTQVYYIPYIALSTGVMVWRKISLSVFGSIGPLTCCFARDVHLKKNVEYYDKMRNGIYYSVAGIASVSVSGNVTFTFRGEYTAIPEFRGDTYSINLFTGEQSAVSIDGAAAGLHFMAFSLSAGYALDL
jgi:outer membrane protease